ncbi:MAG: hypothetical protein ACNS62_20700 [Candidatus Cyclobacteriaceae bacterium M3_2C_046]
MKELLQAVVIFFVAIGVLLTIYFLGAEFSAFELAFLGIVVGTIIIMLFTKFFPKGQHQREEQRD